MGVLWDAVSGFLTGALLLGITGFLIVILLMSSGWLRWGGRKARKRALRSPAYVRHQQASADRKVQQVFSAARSQMADKAKRGVSVWDKRP